MTVRVARLPGIRFEVQPPPPVQVLPRMDIAVFVGFASSGPLNVPVAVEDAAHFQSIFGEDLPLAWDEQRGTMDMAYLAPAVRAFFRNGGRRCYVIRVARAAESNRFPLLGLLRQGQDGQLEQACAQARSQGSWSDGLQAGYELLSQPIRLISLVRVGLSGESYQATLGLARPGDLQMGDLLRLNIALGGERYQCLFVPDTITEGSPAEGQVNSPVIWQDGWVNCQVTWQDGRWFRLPGLPHGNQQGLAQLYDSTSVQGSPPVPISARVPTGEGWQPGSPLALGLDLPPNQAPQPGTLIRADFDDQRLWLVVSRTSEQDGQLAAIGTGLWETCEPDNWTASGVDSFAERLRMSLKVRKAGGSSGDQIAMDELGLAPQQANYWGGLPVDADLYAPKSPGTTNPYNKLWQAAAEPRFPLAGLGPAEDLFFPLTFPGDETIFAGPLPGAGTALERNGLDSFSVDLFLDSLFEDDNQETLVATADYLTYQRPEAHYPTGIYAALRLDEATLIAVPDVLHTGWQRDEAKPDPPEPVQPTPPNLKCTPPLPADLTGQFSDRNLLETPVLTIQVPLEAGGTYQVCWTPVGHVLAGSPYGVPAVHYRLEEAGLVDFSDRVAVYTGDGLAYKLSGYGPGKYYYRVRAEIPADDNSVIAGEWSNGLGVRIGMTSPWKVIPAGEPGSIRREAYETDLVRFQSALLELCAARGDLFAALGLPGFFHEDEALRFAGKLRKAYGETVPRLLSFGALYHPWLNIHEKEQKDQVVRMPPEGAICGAMARRTLARGAWLAAAGEPLQGVVSVQPRIAPGRFLELQEGAVNLVRQEPRGFMNMSEVTLCQEEELRPIHVRRLLMLLRRLVLRQGALYLFEPNSPAFRRQVQSGFEAILADLFTRGAFSGSTPADSYQVDVSDRLNPPASIEQGRLIIEIRVAPSQALLFLTIRLVMTGARSLQVQEG